MNRKKYWSEYSIRKISPSKKEDIFLRISATTSPSPLYQRRSHYVRPVASVVWVAILWVAVFVVWFIGDNQSVQKQWKILQDTGADLPTFVQASPVWRIIQTQWVLWLDTNWVITPIDSIEEWTIITLQGDAKIVFAIDDRIQATITWPARFTIEAENDKSVLLNLLEWSYAQVKTIESLNQETKKDNSDSEFIVKTKELEVSTRTVKSIDLVISQTDDNQAVVTNSWDEVVVKNLETQERIAINEDTEAVRDLTTMIANVWQTQVSSLEKNPPLLAIRYEATQDQVDVLQKVVDEANDVELGLSDSTESIGIDNNELLALVQEPVLTSDSDEVIDTERENTNFDWLNEWRVLDQERMLKLEWILNQKSILSMIDKYTVAEDEAIKREALQNLVNEVNAALWVFNSQWSTTASVQNITLLTQKLIRILEEEYFIPPTLIASVRLFLTLN
jgi:hypothetical protein